MCNENVWHNGMRNQESWNLPSQENNSPRLCPNRAAEGGRKGEGPLEVQEMDGSSQDVVLEAMGYLMHRTRVHVSFAAAQTVQLSETGAAPAPVGLLCWGHSAQALDHPYLRLSGLD